MEQLNLFSIPSPCVGVCSVDLKGYCNGCMRKRDERFNWQKFTAVEKLHVIKLCKQRYRRKVLKGRTKQDTPIVDESPQQDLFH